MISKAQFAALLALNRHKLDRRLRAPRAPVAQERHYKRVLLRIVAQAQRLTRGLLTSNVETLEGDLLELVARAQRAFARAWPDARLSKALGPVTGDIVRANAAALNAVLQHVIGVDVFNPVVPASLVRQDASESDLIAKFVSDNVALIKSVPERMFGELREKIAEHYSQGSMRPDELARTVQERYGVSESRARLIARDQTSKLNGALTSERHRSIGITRAIWRTVGDNRVRDEHEALNGVEYQLSSPPLGGPGAEIQCRCYEDPVLESALEG